MGLGIALDRVVLVEPNEKEAFMDGPIPRLTRSQLIRHCKTHNNAVPESDLEIGSQAYGVWGLGPGYVVYGKGRVVGVLTKVLVFMVSQHSRMQVV